MEEYQGLLDKYFGTPSWDLSLPRTEGNDIEMAKSYMERYWLADSEYEAYWKPIQEKIFISIYGLSEYIFPDSYELIAIRAGTLFIEESFNLLMECFRSIGDKYFVVIENSIDPIPFRFKYPTDISWAEFRSGDFITTVVVDMPNREYFVYTASCKCAKYAASEHVSPLDLIAFKREYEDLFKEKFKVSKEEYEYMYDEWLPENYKGKVIDNSL